VRLKVLAHEDGAAPTVEAFAAELRDISNDALANLPSFNIFAEGCYFADNFVTGNEWELERCISQVLGKHCLPWQ